MSKNKKINKEKKDIIVDDDDDDDIDELMEGLEDDEELNDKEVEEEDLDPTFNSHLYSYMRRAVQRPHTKKNDIYITNNGNFIYYVKRIKKLMFIENIQEVNIHGLGAAIMSAIKLSLYLQRRFDMVLSPTTSTEIIIDQYEPNVDYVDPVSKTRHCSAIHINVKKPTTTTASTQ
ncbi:RNase P protein subunit [Heterostelium album PN500]|uniref:RNase P protein subunit n=1 Tax=Heterostelium pallidum (strain ATCC 26659 / Pp 5 / PN500) TaxID=670386 RepID=D3BE48_HETP5|nr:RNase P protein subunit [Heterostelium album PN500]EFA80179.1 RNase P protein subunit [Heterostelium album PN500]|eukprot:XP_020432299.1 RNase P protein subunit [Heterostelium album PN500]